MKLLILHVPDCPSMVLLRQRLDEAMTDAVAEVEVTEQVVDDADQAAALGMTGSPTLLVDGIDPFAEPGAEPSMSCRLYRDGQGAMSGAPPVAALRLALTRPVP